MIVRGSKTRQQQLKLIIYYGSLGRVFPITTHNVHRVHAHYIMAYFTKYTTLKHQVMRLQCSLIEQDRSDECESI